MAKKIEIFVQAEKFRLEKKYPEAVALFQKVLQLDPRFYEVFDKLGETFQAMDNTEEAVKHYSLAANGYIRDKKFVAAARTYKRLLQLDPEQKLESTQNIKKHMRDLPHMDAKVLSNTLISDLIPRPKFFKDIGDSEFAAVIKSLQPLEVSPNVDVCKEGDKGTSLYIIYSGEVGILSKDNQGREIEISRLGRGEFFGEFGFLTGTPRTATVRTLEESSLLELPRERMQEIIRLHPHVGEVLHSFYKWRILDLILVKSSLFESLLPKERQEIIQKFQYRFFQSGKIVVKEGSKGGELYLIKSGEARVYARNKDQKHIQIASLGPNDFFGEVSYLTGQDRTATVVAATDCEVLYIEKKDLDDIVAEYPRVRETMASAQTQRAHKSLAVFKSKIGKAS